MEDARVGVYDRLAGRDPATLDAAALEELADAAWWRSHVEESLAVRQRAHAAFEAAGDERRAGYNAWMIATEYEILGQPIVAAGWLAKARRHLGDHPECPEQGYLAYSEAEEAESHGDLDGALAHARRMIDIGRRCDDHDVIIMGQQLEGRVLVAAGRVEEGLALLDEAMADVLAGRVSQMVAGWLYCVALGVCFQRADLTRARAWTDAAMSWCATFPEATPYHGLCRVHHVELLGLSGRWDSAAEQADRACTELLAYHPSLAAEAFYVTGELRRRTGQLDAAERDFIRAHELGRDPQPGLALLRLAQGRAEEAAAALAAGLDGGGAPLHQARMLAAQVEVALARDDVPTAEAAASGLSALAATVDAPLISALAATSQGGLGLAQGDAAAALPRLREARTSWLELELPYEAAQVRLQIAEACERLGDEETARLERRAADAVLAPLGGEDRGTAGGPAPAGLSAREVEVLRLVARGYTNRQIAEALVISPHTVGRHLNNIFLKLGVSSRAAATAFAYEHDLLG